MAKKNIILIGMPGAGKSSVGILLSKALKLPFIDTDALLRQKEGRNLQDIIDNDGLDAFLKAEELVVLELDVDGHIIATGGSVIYSEVAVKKLKVSGILVYLNQSLYQLNRRLRNIETRGVAMPRGKSVRDLYSERAPLYRKHADIVIDCSHKHIDKIVAEIAEKTKQTDVATLRD